MKTTLFILCFLIFEGIGYSQVDTKIIQVDLSKPHKRSVTIFTDSSSTALDDSKWLSIKSREKASIKLVNGNPFKYTYKIDTKTIAFFNEKAETENSIKKAEEVAANKMSSSFVADSLISVKTIGKLNQGLNQSIDSLDIDVKFFYDVLIQKNTLDKADYIKRKNLRNRAELNLAKVFELLNDFEKQKPKVKTASLSVREDLLETKDKAIKSIEAIVKKLYTINEDSYTLPIDVEGKNVDVLEFKVRRFDKETKEEDLNFAPNAYNIWIKGGLKIDVSAGIFFTSLYDEEYDKRDDPAIPDNKIITLKNSGDYDMAFGTTINTYIRMNSWIVPTLNFGAVLTKSEKLQVLFGVGAILGKEERIIFSTGVSMGKVDRLANSYSDGGSYNLGTSGVVPTQSQFDFGHFFGVTYNLTKVKKISLDKGIEEN